MTNFIITLFIFVLLITQKIVLLNEESLILLCFITFTLIGTNKLGHHLNLSFQTQSGQIKENLEFSLNQLLRNLQRFSNNFQQFKDLIIKFKVFEGHYKKLTFLLVNRLTNYNRIQLISSYKMKLTFLNKIEKKTVKLLVTIVIKKLDNIIKTKQFYNSPIKISQFLCLNTILIRECISLIKAPKDI